MNDKNLNIIFLGISGFPHRIMAAIQKSKMICLALKNENANITVINRKSVLDNTAHVAVKGQFKGIKYIYSTGSSYRSKNFFRRNFSKIIGYFNEFAMISRLNKRQKIDAAIVYTRFLSLLIFYRLYAKLHKFPLLLNYVEYRSKIPNIKNIREQFNNWLFDRYAFYFADAVLPISDFLSDVVHKICPNKPLLKIPPLVDFHEFNPLKKAPEKYFLFCGYLDYFEVLQFILNAFELVESPTYRLIYVLNGDKRKMNEFQNMVDQSPKRNQISIVSKISYTKLINYYSSASALLIPLRPTIQDIARFPNKIAEYVASGRPLISTQVGEIPLYFTDLSDALIAKDYNEKSYAEKMQFIIDRPEDAANIGKNSLENGMKNFHYASYGKALKDLILQLINR